MSKTPKNLTTVHILTPVRWGNLNRDDQGVPKTTVSGGIQRGLLSPQSIKRSARTRFEGLGIRDVVGSVRSTNLAKAVARPIIEAEPDLDAADIASQALDLISRLTAEKKLPKGDDRDQLIAEIVNDEPVDTGEEDATSVRRQSEAARPTAVWLGEDEIVAARALVIKSVRDGVASDRLDSGEYPAVGSTTESLSIAALGRMNAAAPGTNVDAAVAVGPATSVHGALIESDFFTTVDDLAEGTGAAHMGTRFHTAGTFYRTFTIDRAELRRNWKSIDTPGAIHAVAGLVESLIVSLPTGMTNNSDPYVLPFVVLVEEQAHRVAYDFETPVKQGRDGGYEANAIAGLDDRFAAARLFRPAQFGRSLVAGTSNLENKFDGAERPTDGFDGLVNSIAEWAIAS